MVVHQKTHRWHIFTCWHSRCSFAEWQNVSERLPRYLTREQAHELRDLGFQCCHLYIFAAQLSWGQGQLRFLITPKLHLFHHMTIDVGNDLLNPRAFHCFSGEDFMGFCKQVVQSTPQGTNLEVRVLKRALIKVMSLTPNASNHFARWTKTT